MTVHEPICLSFDQGTLVLSGVSGQALSAAGNLSCFKWDARIGAFRAEAMQYAAVRRALAERFGGRFTDEVMKPVAVSWPKVDLPELRPEQTEAVAAWRISGGRGQVIMPTGTGKTEVALTHDESIANTQKPRPRLWSNVGHRPFCPLRIVAGPGFG